MGRAADPALAEWWLELIERAESGSLSVSEFCRRHDVSTASFYNWRRKLRHVEHSRGGFLPVKVTTTEQHGERDRVVRIVWPQGVMMEIPAGDRELVQLVAGTLNRAEAGS